MQSIISVIFLSVVFSCSALSQSSVRIAIYGGGNLDFVFNSISEYKTGITHTNFTLIGIEVIDGPDLPIDQTMRTWTDSLTVQILPTQCPWEWWKLRLPFQQDACLVIFLVLPGSLCQGHPPCLWTGTLPAEQTISRPTWLRLLIR
ncbi:MAG: hypothetical protein FD166_3809 [Bacteroidetes bacterium]|nr:MAG: hypothetical protein FD166_3809 [Bacteroidota bacterium]